jgi:hypothetical protein
MGDLLVGLRSRHRRVHGTRAQLNESACHRPRTRLVVFKIYLLSKRQDLMELTAAATDTLYRHEWPGNVRELHNALERATIVSEDRLTCAQDLSLAPRGRVSVMASRHVYLRDAARIPCPGRCPLQNGQWLLYRFGDHTRTKQGVERGMMAFPPSLRA